MQGKGTLEDVIGFIRHPIFFTITLDVLTNLLSLNVEHFIQFHLFIVIMLGDTQYTYLPQ